MTYSTLLFSEADGCFRITLNRPERLNAFTSAMHEELSDALRIVENDHPRVLVITGAGRGFCAGQDLGDRDPTAGLPDLGLALERHYNPLIARLAALPAPVVCAVNGVAAGAGVSLALACDIVLARRSAKFAHAFSAIGLVPDAGGSWHLPRRVGQTRALGVALLGQTLSADEAERFGLIWRALDDEAYEAGVEEVVDRLARGPTVGLAETKRLIRSGPSISLGEALLRECDAQRTCGWTADYAEGVAAFKAKRAPRFVGFGPPAHAARAPVDRPASAPAID